MDIYCPYCGTRYELTEQELGRKALCEVCNKKFIIGEGQHNTVAEQDAAEEMKVAKCPHCGTEYDVAANEIGKSAQCEACGRDFIIGTSRIDQQNAPTKKVPRPKGDNCIATATPNYVKNQEYFVNRERLREEAKKEKGCICGLIMAVGGIFSCVFCCMVHPGFGVLVFFATIVVALIIMCIESEPPYSSDAAIDAQAKAMGNNIESIALNKLGIDREEVSLAKPIKFWGYRFVWPSVLGDTADNLATWIRGSDGRHRSSEVSHTIFFFGEHSVYCYVRTASLVCSTAVRDSTEEYFYKDIVSVKTDSKNVPWRDANGVEIAGKTFRKDEFVLTNAGGERRECEVMNPVEAEEAAKAFRMLLRQKKL